MFVACSWYLGSTLPHSPNYQMGELFFLTPHAFTNLMTNHWILVNWECHRLSKCYSVYVLLNTSLSSSCRLCLLFCIRLSASLSQGFVLFSAAVNLLANTHSGDFIWGQASSFWLSERPKNAGA